MNAQKAEGLIIEAYKLEAKTASHEQYLGFIKCLRILSQTDKTLNKKMWGEGLIH